MEPAAEDKVLAGAGEEPAAGVEDLKRIQAGMVTLRPQHRRAVSGV